MPEIVNLRDAEPGEEIDRDGFRCLDRGLGAQLGAELLGGSIYDIPPGQRLWPYHFHRGNEEWVLVVRGRPMLRTPEGERELAAGDLVAFPLDEAGAHTMRNATDETARVVMFSTMNPGTYPVYPDSGKVGANRRSFRLADAVDYWDGEPGST